MNWSLDKKRKKRFKRIFGLEIELIVLWTIGLLVRLVYIIIYPVPNRDSFKYEEFISLWETSGKFPAVSNYPPLCLYFFKTTHALLGLSIIKCNIICNVAFAMATLTVVYYISKRIIQSKLICFLITLVFATHPFAVAYSCQGTRETIYLFFSLLALYSIYQSVVYNRITDVVKTGFYSTFGFMTRHEGLELFVVFIIASFIFNKRTGKMEVLQRILLLMVISISVFVLLSLFMGVSFDYYFNYLPKYNRIMN